MYSGKFNSKYEVQIPSYVTDANYGGTTETYVSSTEVWGRWVPLNSNEVLAEGLIGSQVDGNIFLREKISITTADRLKDKDDLEIYVIDGVVERDNDLHLKVHKYTEG